MSAAGKIIRQSLHSGLFYVLYTASRILLAIALGKTLSSQEYGFYSLVGAAIGIGTGILPLRADQYFVREVPGRPEKEACWIFKSVVGVQTILFLGLLAVVLLLPPLRHRAELLMGLPSRSRLLVLIALLIILESLANEFNRYLYARKEIEKGNLASFLQTGLWGAVIFALFLLKPSAVTIQVVLWAWLIGVSAAVLYAAKQSNPRLLLAAPLVPAVYLTAVRFGLPIVLNNSLQVANSISRFVICRYHSLETVGAVSYSYNLILMIGALSAPLAATPIQPYQIEAYNNGQKKKSGSLLQTELRYRLMTVAPLLIVAVFWEKELIRLFAKSDFLVPGHLMAFLAPIPLFLTVSSLFERILFLERRTAAIGRCYLYAAAMQIGLLFLLVPWNPYQGTALALDGGLWALSLFLFFHIREKELSLRTDFRPIAASSLLSTAAAWAAYHILPAMNPFLTLLCATGIVLPVFLVSLLIFRAVPESERRHLATFIQEKLPILKLKPHKGEGHG